MPALALAVALAMADKLLREEDSGQLLQLAHESASMATVAVVPSRALDLSRKVHVLMGPSAVQLVGPSPEWCWLASEARDRTRCQQPQVKQQRRPRFWRQLYWPWQAVKQAEDPPVAADEP